MKRDARPRAARRPRPAASRTSSPAASASASRSPGRSPSSRSCCCSTSRSRALDKKLREHTQFELTNIQDRTGITFVVVTHDQEEAMTLANRIAVMDSGGIRQIGTPDRNLRIPEDPLRRRLHRLDQHVRRQRRRRDGGDRPRRAARARRRSRLAPSPALRQGRQVTRRGPPGEDRDQPRSARRPQRGRGHGRGSRLLRQGLALPRPPRLRPHPLGAHHATPAASARTSAWRSGRTGSGSPSTRPPPSCCRRSAMP